MTLQEAIETLRKHDTWPLWSVEAHNAIDMAISALEKPRVTVDTNIYDQEEIHHNCTVQILTNSVTGDVSVGWWKEKEGEE